MIGQDKKYAEGDVIESLAFPSMARPMSALASKMLKMKQIQFTLILLISTVIAQYSYAEPMSPTAIREQVTASVCKGFAEAVAAQGDIHLKDLILPQDLDEIVSLIQLSPFYLSCKLFSQDIQVKSQDVKLLNGETLIITSLKWGNNESAVKISVAGDPRKAPAFEASIAGANAFFTLAKDNKND